MPTLIPTTPATVLAVDFALPTIFAVSPVFLRYPEANLQLFALSPGSLPLKTISTPSAPARIILSSILYATILNLTVPCLSIRSAISSAIIWASSSGLVISAISICGFSSLNLFFSTLVSSSIFSPLLPITSPGFVV